MKHIKKGADPLLLYKTGAQGPPPGCHCSVPSAAVCGLAAPGSVGTPF